MFFKLIVKKERMKRKRSSFRQEVQVKTFSPQTIEKRHQCKTVSDCLVNEICVSGRCISKLQPLLSVVQSPPCRQDSDCKKGRTCDTETGKCFVLSQHLATYKQKRSKPSRKSIRTYYKTLWQKEKEQILQDIQKLHHRIENIRRIQQLYQKKHLTPEEKQELHSQIEKGVQDRLASAQQLDNLYKKQSYTPSQEKTIKKTIFKKLVSRSNWLRSIKKKLHKLTDQEKLELKLELRKKLWAKQKKGLFLTPEEKNALYRPITKTELDTHLKALDQKLKNMVFSEQETQEMTSQLRQANKERLLVLNRIKQLHEKKDRRTLEQEQELRQHIRKFFPLSKQEQQDLQNLYKKETITLKHVPLEIMASDVKQKLDKFFQQAQHTEETKKKQQFIQSYNDLRNLTFYMDDEDKQKFNTLSRQLFQQTKS